MSNSYNKYIIFIFPMLILIPNTLLASGDGLLYAFAAGIVIVVVVFLKYLLFGSIILGFIEGALIGKIYKLKTFSTFVKILLGNFVSILFQGFIFFVTIYQTVKNYSGLESIKSYLIIDLIVLMIVPYIIKWPFFYWSVKNLENRIKKSIYAVLIGQTINFLIVILFLIILYVFEDNIE